MSKLKVLTIGCTIAFSMSSFDALAAETRVEGLNACVEAVVTELSDSQGSPMNFSIAPGSEMSSKRLNRREKFHLDIRNPSSDDVLARADCIVNQNAKVQKLIDLPLDARDAMERSEIALY